MLDTSILIAAERGKFDMIGFLRGFSYPQVFISAIVAAELLHGIERAPDPARRARRQRHVEQVLAGFLVQPFDLKQARCHARLWAELETRGQMIGAHDLQIAAAAVEAGHDLGTLNVREFQRVTALRLVDALAYYKP